MTDYAGKIRLGREGAGLYQKDLAKKLGIGERSVQKYESGEVTPPLDKRVLLANILGDPTFLTREERINFEKQEFTAEIGEEFGVDAKTEAEEYLSQLSLLFSGGKLNPDDEEAVLTSMKGIIFDVQERKAGVK